MRKGYFLFSLLALLAIFGFGLKEFRGKDLSLADSLRIDSPGPEQIIKGSIFFVEGSTRGGDDIFVDIKSKDSGETWGSFKAEINGSGQEERKFQARIDTSGRGGWADLQFYYGKAPQTRISIPIRISLSL